MSDFRIAAAQVASVRGDIAANVRTHAAAISAAARQGVSVLVFPELSLTGYEPELAGELAVTPTDGTRYGATETALAVTQADGRLAPLAALARQHQMEVVVGAPLRNAGTKPGLGAILFSADGSSRTYAKMHLGGTEPQYFVPGRTPLSFVSQQQTIGVAICADTSNASHPQAYAERGATIYAASMFLNAQWYATDTPRLAGYAARLPLLVVMANHADSIGTHVSVGKSAVWAPGGALLAEANGTEPTLVIATRTKETWKGEAVPM